MKTELKRWLGILSIILMLVLVGCASPEEETEEGGGGGGDATPDPTYPTVVSVSPTDGSTDVPWDTVIKVTFSETMGVITNSGIDCGGMLQVSSDNFTTCVHMNTVDASADSESKVFTATPTNKLADATTYKIKVTTEAASTEAAALQEEYITTGGFTTFDDITAPTVASVFPTDGSTDVPIDVNPTVTFSELMLASTINMNTDTSCSGAFQLSDDDFATCIPSISRYSWDDTPVNTTLSSTTNVETFDFIPNGSLSPHTTYKLKITMVAEDEGVNTLESVYTTATGFTTDFYKATSVSAGASHTCALLSDQTVQCWGTGTNGELGNGADDNSTTPVTVSGLSNVEQISTSGSHTCALITGGTIQCWGLGLDGQLGDGNSTNSNMPVSVTGITTATQVAAGSNHTCALLTDFSVQCWGHGGNGQLGDNAATDRSTPVAVANLGVNATYIAAGGFFSCAVLSDLSIKCWGHGLQGQLGDGNDITQNQPTNIVTGISNAFRISAGGNHTCALLTDQSIKCWGMGTSGQLGNAADLNSNVPVDVSNIGTNGNNSWEGVKLFASSEHTCTILEDDTVTCWGRNNFSQLGDGTTTDSNIPVVVTGLTNAKDLSGGTIRTFAVLYDSAVAQWGQGVYPTPVFMAP